jgi:cysteine-S-conjugate beta-lyase
MYYNFDEIINRENTCSYKYDLRHKIFKKEDVIPMWVADMDFNTPPYVIDALRKRLEHEILGYSYISPAVYKSIVTWNKLRHGWTIKPEWISFSPGVVPAINLLVLAFTEPGDQIIVQPPVYFPFFPAVENHGRKLVTNPLHYENGAYGMDFEDMESKINEKTRMFILCNPHNPTGNVWSGDVLRRLGEICMRHGILLVSDEIHGDLVYPGNRHIPAAGISPGMAANTITCMAPSKTFNLAGLSTSYLVIPDEKKKMQYERKLDQIHVGAGNLFGFVAMEAAYSHGEEWLDQLMNYVAGNYRLLQEFISQHIPQISVVRPQATYMVWLDCTRMGMSPAELKDFMIHMAGLGLSDGPIFGKGGEGFQRINIGCPRSVLYQALLKLQAAIVKYFANK